MNPATADPAKAEPQQIHALADLKYTAPLMACRFDPSGKYVFATAGDNTIQRWQLGSDKATPLVGHDSWVRALAFHAGSGTLLSGGYDGRLISWEIAAEAPQPLRTIEAHEGWVRAVAVSPDGKWLASCGNDNLVKIWNAADGTLAKTCAGHANHVYNVAFHPQGAMLVSGDLKGVVKEWDVASGEPRRQIDAAGLWKYDPGFQADIGGVRAMAFRADGKLLACGGITDVSNAFAGIGNPLVVVFDFEKGEKVQLLLTSAKLKAPTTGVKFHPEGFLISSCGGLDGGHLLFWRIEQPNEFFDFKLPDTCRDFDLHPDGLRVCTAHEDKTLRLWQMTPKPK
jgi:WD40 repeat protein